MNISHSTRYFFSELSNLLQFWKVRTKSNLNYAAEAKDYGIIQPVTVIKTYRKGSFSTTAKVWTNMADFTDDHQLTPKSKINLGVMNYFYREVAVACEVSDLRLISGHSLKDMVPVQEGLCLIYRKNVYDMELKFFRYLLSQHKYFVLNQCCACEIQDKCKLYLHQLAYEYSM